MTDPTMPALIPCKCGCGFQLEKFNARGYRQPDLIPGHSVRKAVG